MTKHYDYIAIGGGSGGNPSNHRAAMYGQKSAPVASKELGGTRGNVWCVPEKRIWQAGQNRGGIHHYGPG